MNRAAHAVRWAMLIGLALGACGICAAVVRAQTVLHNYVPAKTSFTDVDSTSHRTVCVIGYSVQKLGLTAGSFTFNVPAYYLAKTGWQPATGSSMTITALPVGTAAGQVSSIPSEPSASEGNATGYLNSGNLTFYIAPAKFSCSKITYTWINQTAGIVTVPYYPYPSVLVETSIYPVPDGAGVDNEMTVDGSNVDGFQNPFEVAVENRRKVPYAYFGNPVTSITPLISRKTLISGPGDAGGKASPFYTWINTIREPNAKIFENLALAYPTYPYATIIAPNDYLQIKCQQSNGTFIPSTANCATGADIGLLVNFNDPLNSYYDRALGKFFDNAAGMPKLIVMGDAQGTTAAGPWTVRRFTSCPLYLTTPAVDHSLQFINSASSLSPIILCNPVNQLAQLVGSAPSLYTQTPAGRGVKQTATMALTSAQCTQAQNHVGWNFVQPSSGWVGNIKGVDCGTNTMTLTVLDGPGTFTPPSSITQKACVSNGSKPNNCPLANTSNSEWIWTFSNVAYVGSTVPWETASDMVLANDGAFSGAWLSVIYSGGQLTVAESIARNIVWAFNHGIANCNNVTMLSGAPPAVCAHVEKLTATQMNPTTAAKASDAYWSREQNWYPRGGTNNFYAEYLHTFRLPTAKPTTNIFNLPQRVISGTADSNQNVPMGMAYGFAYDENPDYLSQRLPAQVPAKFDPIPPDWFTTANDLRSVRIMIGR